MKDPVLRGVTALAAAYNMLPPGELILVALSGGGDSMCLLHALLTLGVPVAAAHFNHRLRPEAKEEERFVRDWCAARGVPCHTGEGEVARVAAGTGGNLEETARRLRYDFLTQTAKRIGASRVATAHHAGDNAETVLLNLLRGSGSRGLAGIPPVRGNIVRPLLTTEREEILAYLERYGVPHVEDASNRDTAYRRNFLRREVLPLLEQVNPKFQRHLWETACQLRREDEYLDGAARAVLRGLTRTDAGVSVPREDVTGLPDALSLRGIQLLARELDDTLSLTASHRQAVLDLCRSSAPSGEVHLPGDLVARRNYDRLELSRNPGEDAPFAPVPLALPGVTVAAGWRCTSRETVCPPGKFNRPRQFYLALPSDAAVTLRPRRTGDAIALPGRNRKTLKKLMIDAKIPRRDRVRLPVLECGGTVCALTGFGADQRFLPTPGQCAWQVTVEPITTPCKEEHPHETHV